MYGKKYINLNFNDVIPEDYVALECKLKHFTCGEFEFSVLEDVANIEVIIFQKFEVGRFNDDLLKLQIVCDVLKRNNAKKITYFAPFLPYTRQDRTYDTKSSLGSKLVAEIINSCRINEVITYDMHALQVEGFFNCKVLNHSMIPFFIDDIKSRFSVNNIVIVFPDSGAASRSKKFFSNEDYDIAIINKNRKNDGYQMKILGDVSDKISIIIDDMIDSAGTIVEAHNVLLANGANEVFVYATHALFTGNALEKLNDSAIKAISVMNSVAGQAITNEQPKIKLFKIPAIT